MTERKKISLSRPAATGDTPPAHKPPVRAVAAFFGGRNFVAGRAAGGIFHSPLGPMRLPPGAPEGPGVQWRLSASTPCPP